MYDNVFLKIENNLRKCLYLLTHKNLDLDSYCSTISFANYIKNKYNIEVVCILDIDSISYDGKVFIDSNITILKELEKIDSDFICVVLDVNEKNLLYGLKYLENIPINNRYLIDHHKGGNNCELQILNDNKINVDNSSSTCEIIADYLLNNNICSINNAYNLYTGIASDSYLFQRGLSNNTLEICSKLPLSDSDKSEILENIMKPTEDQIKLLNKISSYQIDDIAFYCIEVEKEEEINKLKHFVFDDKIKLKCNDEVSVFLIKINNKIIARLRKKDNSDINILSISKKYCGGGHLNRCRAYFYDCELNEVIELLISEINNSKDEHKCLKKLLN